MGKGWVCQTARKWFISSALSHIISAFSCWARMEGGSCLKLGRDRKKEKQKQTKTKQTKGMKTRFSMISKFLN